jgi:hypothetical protein
VSAVIDLTIESAGAASVEALFELAGSGPIVVLLADLPGQRVEDLEASMAGRPVALTTTRRSSALRAFSVDAAAVGDQLTLAYRVTNATGSDYRYALPVPEAVPTGEERSVRLAVSTPAGAAFAGNAFPPLTGTGPDAWEASLVAVPSLVHMVFGEAGIALRQHRVLEGLAIGGALGLLLFGWGWSRRRAASGATTP